MPFFYWARAADEGHAIFTRCPVLSSVTIQLRDDGVSARTAALCKLSLDGMTEVSVLTTAADDSSEWIDEKLLMSLLFQLSTAGLLSSSPVNGNSQELGPLILLGDFSCDQTGLMRKLSMHEQKPGQFNSDLTLALDRQDAEKLLVSWGFQAPIPKTLCDPTARQEVGERALRPQDDCCKLVWLRGLCKAEVSSYGVLFEGKLMMATLDLTFPENSVCSPSLHKDNSHLKR